MFGQTFFRCPGCGTDIRHRIEHGEEFDCPACNRRYRTMLDERAGKAGLVEIVDKEIPEPLFLPKGSIRALVTLAAAVCAWILMFAGRDVPSSHLGLLLTIIGYYFGFRMKMKAAESRIHDAVAKYEEPLFLPPGLIRFFLIAGFLAAGVALGRRGRLAELAHAEFFVLLAGLVAGFLFAKLFPSARPSAAVLLINHIKGAAVLLAAGWLSYLLLSGLHAQQGYLTLALCSVVTFYFGSRS